MTIDQCSGTCLPGGELSVLLTDGNKLGVHTHMTSAVGGRSPKSKYRIKGIWVTFCSVNEKQMLTILILCGRHTSVFPCLSLPSSSPARCHQCQEATATISLQQFSVGFQSPLPLFLLSAQKTWLDRWDPGGREGERRREEGREGGGCLARR